MLSKNIKYLRETHGMTQSDIADIVGVTDKAVSTWENGTYQPRIGVIEKLANYFKVSKSALLDTDMSQENAYMNKPATPEDDGLSPERKELMDKIKKLSDVQFRMVSGILDQVLAAQDAEK